MFFAAALRYVLLPSMLVIAAWTAWRFRPKNSSRWYLPLVATLLLEWTCLPSLVLELQWSYHTENTTGLGESVVRDLLRTYPPTKVVANVAKICGDSEGFDINDPSLNYVGMPERQEYRRFFYLSPYDSVTWVGVGWKGRYCQARYKSRSWPFGYPSTVPNQFFPYPIIPWIDDFGDMTHELLERIPSARPAGPEGVTMLFPGECGRGEISNRDTLRFQVQTPDLGQKNQLKVVWECNDPIRYYWTRNGKPVDESEKNVDKEGGAATYQVTLLPPAKLPNGFSVHYVVCVYWRAMSPHYSMGDWYGKCPNDSLDDGAPQEQRPDQ